MIGSLVALFQFGSNTPIESVDASLTYTTILGNLERPE